MAGISCLVDELRDIKKDLRGPRLKLCKLTWSVSLTC